MELDFIPLDYDSFDFEGRNYIKVFGKTSSGKRVCLIDKCDTYFWAILKAGVSEKKIEKIRKKIEGVELEISSRKSGVLKTVVEDKKYLGRDVQAIKIFVSNHKDMGKIAHKISFKEVEKRREHDVSYITRYII